MRGAFHRPHKQRKDVLVSQLDVMVESLRSVPEQAELLHQPNLPEGPVKELPCAVLRDDENFLE
jgi:hypothetical protein